MACLANALASVRCRATPLVIDGTSQASGCLIRNAIIMRATCDRDGAVIAFRSAGSGSSAKIRFRHADAIVVLSGSMPARAEEAAKIFQMGYAPEVWLTRRTAPVLNCNS